MLKAETLQQQSKSELCVLRIMIYRTVYGDTAGEMIYIIAASIYMWLLISAYNRCIHLHVAVDFCL